MTKTQLNFKQISGLFLILIGTIINDNSVFSISTFLIIIGIFVFLSSSRVNLGITFSAILFIIGSIFDLNYFPYAHLLILYGVIGITIFGLYQIANKRKGKVVICIFSFIVIYLIERVLRVYGLSYFYNFNYREFISIIGHVGIFLCYTYRFYKKSNKNFEDILKLSFLYTGIALTLDVTIRINIPFEKYVSVLFGILLLIWIIMSLVREIKSMKTST